MNLLASWHGGFGPGPWVLLFPLLWIVVIATVVLLVRRLAGRRGCGPSHGQQGPPLELLGRRFAAGEIDEGEYRRRSAVLQQDGRSADLRKGGGPDGPEASGV